VAGLKAGAIKEAAIEGDVIVGVADEAAKLCALEIEDGAAAERGKGAQGLKGGV
jgi:hypothetical protein